MSHSSHIPHCKQNKSGHIHFPFLNGAISVVPANNEDGTGFLYLFCITSLTLPDGHTQGIGTICSYFSFCISGEMIVFPDYIIQRRSVLLVVFVLLESAHHASQGPEVQPICIEFIWTYATILINDLELFTGKEFGDVYVLMIVVYKSFLANIEMHVFTCAQFCLRYIDDTVHTDVLDQHEKR